MGATQDARKGCVVPMRELRAQVAGAVKAILA
jgi:hypothetical protein